MRRAALLFITASLGAAACSGGGGAITTGPSTFHVEVTAVNGQPPPTEAAPRPANRGDTTDTWDFTIEARDPTGAPTAFDGAVRLSVRPGAILAVSGDGAVGRNFVLKGGKGKGSATVTAVYGPTRLWVEDIGYVPAKVDGGKPACANGVDDNGDVSIDYPADPGCAFADDDSEGGGTFAAGVSQPVAYALPKISDVQGDGSTTPYPFEAIEINAASPQRLVVTRVASDGFYVTDVSPAEQANGYNHIFAFNFSTPPGMRVCDVLTYLSGTTNEFFGFTELSFPSYDLSYPVLGKDPCEVPEPTLIDLTTLADPVAMEKIESGLVRIADDPKSLLGLHVAKNFGPELVKNNVPGPNASNCDLNGDGQVDFMSQEEGACSKVCDSDPECSEWTAFSARGNFKVSDGTAGGVIQIQTGTVSGFDPVANRGKPLRSVTGTLRNFSGGTLNWTIETRCPDDLACDAPGCVPQAISSQTACVRLRTVEDNDQGTN